MIFSWLKTYALKACIIGLASVSLFAGLQTWRLSSAHDKIDEQAATHKAELDEIDKASRKETDRRQKEAEKRQTQQQEIDRKYQEELTRAKTERDNLDAGIRSGKYRVYVRANCPAPGGVPEAGNSGGVDSGAGAELSAEAGQLVSDIREGAKRFDAKLAACQEALKVELSR